MAKPEARSSEVEALSKIRDAIQCLDVTVESIHDDLEELTDLLRDRLPGAAPARGTFAFSVGRIVPKEPKMPLTFTLTNEEMVEGITVSPVSSAGRPKTIQPGSLTLTIIDGNPNASSAITGDNSFNLISGDGEGGIGSTTFRVDGDADLGDGVVTISDTVILNVGGSLATGLGLGGGSVIPKP